MSKPKPSKRAANARKNVSPAMTPLAGDHVPIAQPHSHTKNGSDMPTFARSRGVNALIEKYADGKTGRIVIPRLVEGTGLTRKSLAGTIGISVDAICRTELVNSPATQTRLREMLEILGRITDWAGGEVQAMAWYRAQPIPAFGSRTAESLVKSNQAGPLRDYLEHVAMGGFA